MSRDSDYHRQAREDAGDLEERVYQLSVDEQGVQPADKQMRTRIASYSDSQDVNGKAQKALDELDSMFWERGIDPTEERNNDPFAPDPYRDDQDDDRDAFA